VVSDEALLRRRLSAVEIHRLPPVRFRSVRHFEHEDHGLVAAPEGVLGDEDEFRARGSPPDQDGIVLLGLALEEKARLNVWTSRVDKPVLSTRHGRNLQLLNEGIETGQADRILFLPVGAGPHASINHQARVVRFRK